jgi:hypothetical protein
LRKLDLSEPMPDPDRDDPMPPRPEQVEDAVFAGGLSPAAGVEEPWTVSHTETPPVDRAPSLLSVDAVRPDFERVADAVFAHSPEAWDSERLGLMMLGVLGLSWRPRWQGHAERGKEGNAWVQRASRTRRAQSVDE